MLKLTCLTKMPYICLSKTNFIRMPPIKIAIIDSNVLTGIGLQNLLEGILPTAEVTVLRSFSVIESEEHVQYAHFFVASRIYFEHTQFFRNHPIKSIVLVNGEMSISGVRTLNVCQDENALVRDIFNLHKMGHGMKDSKGAPHPMGGKMPHSTCESTENVLSAREIEVAILLSKGFINKEIADRLNISITTVISHRKNIMEKLRARSLADIIIYCVMKGLVDVGEL